MKTRARYHTGCKARKKSPGEGSSLASGESARSVLPVPAGAMPITSRQGEPLFQEDPSENCDLKQHGGVDDARLDRGERLQCAVTKCESESAVYDLQPEDDQPVDQGETRHALYDDPGNQKSHRSDAHTHGGYNHGVRLAASVDVASQDRGEAEQ